ncbi:MAG: Crp/Fnr family transcriptional regulator [Lachnospiraceae bacterium]|nr:Crp/Fnr family transcriptional regulator [Lachnospiraceae bacterium]
MNEIFWKMLTEYGIRQNVDKNVTLSSDAGVYLLEDGICALTGFTKKGEEQVYLYFHPKKIIGFSPTLRKQRSSTPITLELGISVVTRTPCTLWRIFPDTFRTLLEGNHDFSLFLVDTLSENYVEVLSHFHSRIEDSVSVRLCRLLLELSHDTNGLMTIPKFFTYMELSRYLGCHSVTVSRIMARLKQQGIIAKGKDGLVLQSVEALKELIESEGDFDY